MDRRKALFALAIILSCHACQLAYFIFNEAPNPSWDESWHLANTLYYRWRIFGGGEGYAQWTRKFPLFVHSFENYPHPNVFYFLCSLIPLEYDGILAVQMLFLSILVVSTYDIGRRLFDEDCGITAAFLVAAYPLTLNLTRRYLIDLPLAALVALDIYLLLRTDSFKNGRQTAYFVAVFAAGMLVKRTFAAFVVPALAYSILKVLAGGKSMQEKTTALAAAAFAALCIRLSPFYPQFLGFL